MKAQSAEKTYFKGYLQTGSVEVIAQNYDLVSYAPKSVPTPGSPCKKTEKLNADWLIKHDIKKISVKKDGSVVVYYPEVVLRFWKRQHANPAGLFDKHMDHGYYIISGSVSVWGKVGGMNNCSELGRLLMYTIYYWHTRYKWYTNIP